MAETSKGQVLRFAIDESEDAWLARAVHAIPEGVIVTDAQGRVVATNSAAEQLLGGSPCVGMPVAEILELRDRATGALVELPVAEAMASGASVELDEHAVFTGKDGAEIFLQGRIAPLRDGAQIRGLVLSFRDATHQRLQEAVMARLVERMHQTLDLLHVFIGVVGHELKTPLGSILLSAQLLLRTGGEAGATSGRRILNSGRRMSKMIEHLVDFARLQTKRELPLRPRSTNLGEVCREVLEDLTRDHPRRALTTDFEGVLEGDWDPDRIRQVVSNLVGNALLHGDPEGRVTVRIDGWDREVVVLSVENHGEMPHGIQSVAFDPLSIARGRRTKVQGLGLGLYVSQEIARLHGGSLTAKSDGGRTLVVMRLPRKYAAISPRP
jgi:PAS domain S-box-containing protein